jgi:prolyl-tRNA synthetase
MTKNSEEIMAKVKKQQSRHTGTELSDWYQEVVRTADMAEIHPSECMVIKPWGYAIWENMMHLMDVFSGKQG